MALTLARQREADTDANARAAIAPFVQAYRALDTGLTDAQRAMFIEWTANDRSAQPDLYNRVKVRREIERRIGSPALELCFAKASMEEAAGDILLAYPDAAVTFAGEVAA